MIEELRLTRFKGFRDFSLKCSPFTTLVGLNNSGKTSILQAIKLLFDAYAFTFRGAEVGPDFASPHWQSNAEQLIRGVSAGDPGAIWLHKNIADPCNISASLSNGVEVKLEIRGLNLYDLDVLRGGLSIRENPVDPEHRQTVAEVYNLRPAIVPPTGSVSPAENFMSFPALQSQLASGRISECWRAYLYWLYQEKGEAAFENVEEAIASYLPALQLLHPTLTRDGTPRFLVRFHEEGTTLDISVSGGGLRTLIALCTVLWLSDSRCLLLDEPDAHLHSSLQRQVAQMLWAHAVEKGVQVFTATHSPDFIAEVPVESLVWVDRTKERGQPCSEVGRVLVDLGAITNADAIRAYGADKILFVEGSLDRRVLAQLFALSDHKDPFADETVIIATLPHGKGDVVHVRLFQQLLQETLNLSMRVACLTDNDYDLQQTSGDAPGDEEQVLLLRLGRKEVENYFLESQVLAKAGELSARRRQERSGVAVNFPSAQETGQYLAGVLDSAEVRNIVRYQVVPRYRETLDPHLARPTKEEKAETWFEESWQDGDWRLRNSPGKKVLRRLRDWFQREFALTLTDATLLEALRESQGCPEDIKQLAKTIEQFLYGGEIQDPEPQSEEEGSDEVGSCA